jgi:hypothetical protein
MDILMSYPNFKRFAGELIEYFDEVCGDYQGELRDSSKQIIDLTEQITQFIQREKAYITEIEENKKNIESLTRQNDTYIVSIDEMRHKHRRDLDESSRTKNDFSLIQAMSKENADLKRENKILESQLKSIRMKSPIIPPPTEPKKLVLIKKKKPVVPIEHVSLPEETTIVTVEPIVQPEEKPIITVEPIVQPEEKPIITVEPIVQPEEKPSIIVEPIIQPEEKPIVTVEPIVQPEEKPIVTVEPIVQPEEKPLDRKTLSKIKIKGVIYFITKAYNENNELTLYECLDGNPGRFIGNKNKSGVYVFA